MYALRDLDVRDVAAKMSFSINQGFSGADGSASEVVNGCRVDYSVGGSGASVVDIFGLKAIEVDNRS